MDSPELLARVERQADGTWIVREPAVIETPRGPVRLEPGMRLALGQRVEGLDVAEYLEQLGAQFGS